MIRPMKPGMTKNVRIGTRTDTATATAMALMIGLDGRACKGSSTPSSECVSHTLLSTALADDGYDEDEDG